MEMEEHNNTLTPTGLADKLIDELTVLGELLSTTDQQRIIKKFGDYILEHRSSIAEATHLLPLESALVVIQVREHQNTRHEINELHERVDNLIKELRELKKKLDEKE